MLYDGQTNVPTSCNIDSFDRDELERAARTWQAIRRAVNYIGRKSMASVTRNIFRHRYDFSIELNLESVWLVKLVAGRWPSWGYEDNTNTNHFTVPLARLLVRAIVA